MEPQTTPDPIDALHAEHDEALAQLRVLGRAGHALAEQGARDEHLAAFVGAVRFLDHEIRAHNEWEEVHLFPRLEAYLGPGGPCVVMRAEHRELWDLYARLAPLLEAARAGRASRDDLGMLSHAADAIADLLSAHIEKENQILFPMARRFLAPADVAALAAARPEPR